MAIVRTQAPVKREERRASPQMETLTLEVVKAFRRVGFKRGDIIFGQVEMEGLCFPYEDLNEDELFNGFFDAIMEVIGPEGSLLVPAFSFSFCRGEIYDPILSPSRLGSFNERFRKMNGVRRSSDPILSVAGIGPHVDTLFKDLPHDCLGKGSFYQRLVPMGAKILTMGKGRSPYTFLHHIEQMLKVPHRFNKIIMGTVEENGRATKQGWLYNVRILADNGSPDFSLLEADAKEAKLCRELPFYSDTIQYLDCQKLYKMVWSKVERDPWYLARGPEGDPAQLDRKKVGIILPPVDLPPDATMEEMINSLWKLPRDILSEGYDAALEALANQIPMTLHEYPSGTQCWTWIVPEKWDCRHACLETLEGRRIFSYSDNPLHVVSYSLPFSGVVSRGELFKHLHVHPKNPGAIPYKFKYYERDWGLSCSQNIKDSLRESYYRVVIDSFFCYGKLKIGEVVAPGTSDESIVLCAHLCHPGMVNDDLSGVVVGLEVMRALRKRRDLRYNYRFLIMPETIGSVAYLSHNENLIPKMKGGLDLDMLGLVNPHALQLSFQGDTEIDQCFEQALKERDPQSFVGAFRTISGCDERQFNAPGVRVPMLSLTRVLPVGHPDWPYPEYHTHLDNPQLINLSSLEESCDVVLKMIDTIEENHVPINNTKGEIFLSRYGLHIDWYTNPAGNKALFDVLYLIDGTRSISEIARISGVSFKDIRRFVNELRRNRLVIL